MLELKDFIPIDKDKVKTRWDEIMNVPNDQWNIRKLDHEIDVINDEDYPTVLRTVKLNMLPALVINIIKQNKS